MGRPPADDAETRTAIEELLEEIRWSLRQEGGDVDLLEVSEGAVRLAFAGTVAASRLNVMLLCMGIERAMRERVAGFTRIIPEVRGGG